MSAISLRKIKQFLKNNYISTLFENILRKIKQFLKNNYISTLFENMNLIKQLKTKVFFDIIFLIPCKKNITLKIILNSAMNTFRSYHVDLTNCSCQQYL